MYLAHADSASNLFRKLLTGAFPSTWSDVLCRCDPHSNHLLQTFVATMMPTADVQQ